MSFQMSLLEALPLPSCICARALNSSVAESMLLEGDELIFTFCGLASKSSLAAEDGTVNIKNLALSQSYNQLNSSI